MVLKDSDTRSNYATGGQISVSIYITGVVKMGNAEIAVLDSDLGSIETQKKYVSMFGLKAYLKIETVFCCISKKVTSVY